ncbi:hypothetical protein [Clostridiisalibacter paucivorans]|uniref:hypothetical protein n=1 Tax=Clostridiisalibacter paucivorans TaxID=408753 RepID=UPI00047E2799|nr:hypothetical protein [Clostridiisalibacter paucivorans]
MGRRRVGTISMAIVLILSGVMLFVAQGSKISAIEWGLKFWPIIPIILGGEILWYSYKIRDSEIKIRYDILSIFIIIIIMGTNIVIYSLVQLDVVSKVNLMVSAKGYDLSIPHEELPIDNTINKIIIDAPSYCDMNIRVENTDSLLLTGNVRAYADSKEKAKGLVKSDNLITHRSGDSLYVSFDASLYGNNAIYYSSISDYTLVIPDNMNIEINDGSYLNLIVQNIDNDITIDNFSSITMRIDNKIDALINGNIDNDEDLKGNIQWNNNKASFGNGKNKINIINADEIIVNTAY